MPEEIVRSISSITQNHKKDITRVVAYSYRVRDNRSNHQGSNTNALDRIQIRKGFGQGQTFRCREMFV